MFACACFFLFRFVSCYNFTFLEQILGNLLLPSASQRSLASASDQHGTPPVRSPSIIRKWGWGGEGVGRTHQLKGQHFVGSWVVYNLLKVSSNCRNGRKQCTGEPQRPPAMGPLVWSFVALFHSASVAQRLDFSR